MPPSRAIGLTDDEIARIARGPDAAGWDPFDAAVLRAADELHIDSFVSDATWQMLSTRYDVNQLVDTVDTVGTLTMHAGMINSLGIEVEGDIKDRLPPVPFNVAAKRTNIGRKAAARIPPQEAAAGGEAPAETCSDVQSQPGRGSHARCHERAGEHQQPPPRSASCC